MSVINIHKSFYLIEEENIMNIVLYLLWKNCFFPLKKSMFNIFCLHEDDFVYVQRILSFLYRQQPNLLYKKWRKNDFQSCCCCYQKTLSGYERFNSTFGSLLVTFTLFSLIPVLKKILKRIFSYTMYYIIPLLNSS